MGLLPIASQVLLHWLDKELDNRGQTCCCDAADSLVVVENEFILF